MTIQRTASYMPVTGISRYLTGDKSCIWAAWFKANHQNYARRCPATSTRPSGTWSTPT